jgi:hypothetical protein
LAVSSSFALSSAKPLIDARVGGCAILARSLSFLSGVQQLPSPPLGARSA